MINLILQSFRYVTGDPFFFAAMGFTTAIGVFVGAVVYDGNMKEIKKGIVLLSSYCVLLIIVNLTRILPQIPTVPDPYKPFAGLVTIVLVTIFYLLGMGVGVKITKHAHKGRVDLKV